MKHCIVALLGAFLIMAGSLAVAADTADTAEGEALYRKYCASCHGNDGAKTPIGSVPIKGQSAEDIQKKLAGYIDGTYGGNNKMMMQNSLKRISPEDLAVIEAYIQTL